MKLQYVLIALLFLCVGYLAYSYTVREEPKVEQSVTTPTPSTAADEDAQNTVAQSNTVVTNTQYRYRLTLNENWGGYFVRDEGTTIRYCLPTTDTSYTLNRTESGVLYACPFAIGIESDWTALDLADRERVNVIGERGDVRFTFSIWQDTPEDLRNIDFGISDIPSTFETY